MILKKATEKKVLNEKEYKKEKRKWKIQQCQECKKRSKDKKWEKQTTKIKKKVK